jgi:hypothetical protein
MIEEPRLTQGKRFVRRMRVLKPARASSLILRLDEIKPMP